MILKVIHRLQDFSNAIRRTFVQHFTRFQMTVCSHGSSALAELLARNSYKIKVALIGQLSRVIMTDVIVTSLQHGLAQLPITM